MVIDKYYSRVISYHPVLGLGLGSPYGDLATNQTPVTCNRARAFMNSGNDRKKMGVVVNVL
jgi:hypothetical protein